MTKEFSLEKNLAQIRQLVERMQKGVDNFDEQIKLYQQGMGLIHNCREFLSNQELKIKQIGRDSVDSFEVDDEDEIV